MFCVHFSNTRSRIITIILKFPDPLCRYHFIQFNSILKCFLVLRHRTINSKYWTKCHHHVAFHAAKNYPFYNSIGWAFSSWNSTCLCKSLVHVTIGVKPTISSAHDSHTWTASFCTDSTHMIHLSSTDWQIYRTLGPQIDGPGVGKDPCYEAKLFYLLDCGTLTEFYSAFW